MKKVERYVCDVCGTLYDNEGDCVRCESLHSKVIDNNGIELKYVPGQKYPNGIEVHFRDAVTLVYTLKREKR